MRVNWIKTPEEWISSKFEDSNSNTNTNLEKTINSILGINILNDENKEVYIINKFFDAIRQLGVIFSIYHYNDEENDIEVFLQYIENIVNNLLKNLNDKEKKLIEDILEQFFQKVVESKDENLLELLKYSPSNEVICKYLWVILSEAIKSAVKMKETEEKLSSTIDGIYNKLLKYNII
jgi:hypothetical protein